MTSKLAPLRKSKKLSKPFQNNETDITSSTDSSYVEKREHKRKRSDSQAGKKDQISKDNDYLKRIKELKESIPNWDNIYVDSKDNNNESRVDQLIRVEVIGQSLCDKFAWAIPDKRALKILANFSPLIEIGAGKGYWAHLLSTQYSCDIICYDKYKIKKPWIRIHRGGPEVLQLEDVVAVPASSSSSSSVSSKKQQQSSSYQPQKRNLFLCYPDEAESMAIDCLHTYTGDYIIHVGELMVSGGTKSQVQSPWGRTSTSEFQVTLMEMFHCVLMAEIPRFPFSSDHISVWKRTKTVSGKETALAAMNDDDEEEEEVSDDKGGYNGNGSKRKKVDVASKNTAYCSSKKDNANNDVNCDDGNENSDGGEDEDNEEDNDQWNSIPEEEIIRWNIAAPAYAHLL